MSAPMPDFEMPDEASEGRGSTARLPRGPHARRIVAIGVTAVVLATLAIVGVPALVEQQRGRDAVAVVERYAADVADGDVDAVLAALAPDAREASEALLLEHRVVPTTAIDVDDVELLAVEGPRAVVRVHHTIGIDEDAAVVVLVDRGGEWRVVEGLLGVVGVPLEYALGLGDADAAGDAWALPGGYEVPEALLGAVEVGRFSYVVMPGERTGMSLGVQPSLQSASLGVDAVRAFVDEYRATCGDSCLLLGDETDVPPSMTWDLDLATRSGTMLAMITTTVEEQTSGGQVVARSVIANVAFEVTIADDLQSLVVTPATPPGPP